MSNSIVPVSPNSGNSVFNFQGQPIRVIVRDGIEWFVAKDVCDALELGNSRQALTRLGDDEKGDVILNDASNHPQKMSTVNESGLYRAQLPDRTA